MPYTPSAQAIAARVLLDSYLVSIGAAVSTQPERVEAIYDSIINSGLTWTFRGAWSNATAYIPGDVVTSGGGVYLSILAGTNHDPATSPTYWIALGSGGGGGGAPVFTIASKSADFTAAAGYHYLVDTSGGDVTATMPVATGICRFSKTQAGNKLIFGGATIDGDASAYLAAGSTGAAELEGLDGASAWTNWW